VRLERQRWLPRLQLLGLTAIAAWNFLWQLGSSSLYVDEVQSVNVATQPRAHFVHALSSIEITPPGYFLLLHEWVLVGIAALPADALPGRTGDRAVVRMAADPEPGARTWRWAYAGCCLLLVLALVPLLIGQHGSLHGRPGVSVSGALSSDSLLNMVQVPFVGRVERLRLLGALVAASGFLTVLIVSLRRRYPRGPAGRLALVLTIAAGGPLTLVALSAAGGHAFWGHLMLARYAGACGPFVLVPHGVLLRLSLRVFPSTSPTAAILAAPVP